MNDNPNEQLLREAKQMDEIQTRCFSMFVGLGPMRTLSTLHTQTQERDMQVTMRMLQRWSAKWQWSKLATLTQQGLANEVAEAARPALRAEVKADMDTIAILKARFHKRAAIDPFDPTVTPEDRALAIIPDLSDYEKLLRLERNILGDPDEQDREGLPSRMVLELSSSDVAKILAERTRAKYGLPDPDKLKDVSPSTIDHE